MADPDKNRFFAKLIPNLTKGVIGQPLNKHVGTRQTNDTPMQLRRRTLSGKYEMLVLSRKVGEKLVIGDNITVEVVRISGNRITLGLVAPADVKILRSELKQSQDVTTDLTNPLRQAS